MEVKFHVWEWEEELRKLNLENVGLGNTSKKHLILMIKVITQLYLLLALIINSVGLVVSIIVFVIEKIIRNS